MPTIPHASFNARPPRPRPLLPPNRQIFERWMEWEPDDNGWNAYVKFEMRQQEPERARRVFERYVQCHPTQRAFLKYAKWVQLAHRTHENRTSPVAPPRGQSSGGLTYVQHQPRKRCIQPHHHNG
jgi:hypothetical protein